MEKEFKQLYYKYKRIQEKGWIKSLRKGSTGVGYTFETLMNKKEDNLREPDYNGIEIKTMKYFSKKKIHLFNATPIGKDGSAIKNILQKLGYPDKENPQYIVFNVNLNTQHFTQLAYKRIKIWVNWKEKRIELIAYNMFGFKINIEAFWTFELLENALNTKLKKLAIIKACSKKIKGEEYYLYSGISLYKLKDFETFLKLIDNGIIEITFKIGLWRNNERFGMIHDRGTNFSILEKDIPLLFEKI